MSLTVAVREELAHLADERGDGRLGETSALLRFAGSWVLSGDDFPRRPGWLFQTSTGAVARRLLRSLSAGFGLHPEVKVLRPGGLARSTTYRVLAVPPDNTALRTLGLVDADGRPVHDLPERLLATRSGRTSYLRGAVMAAGTVSAPHHAPHLEIRAPGEASARGLAQVLDALGVVGANAGVHAGSWRVVCKSSDAVASLLTQVGAHTAFLQFDQGRLRRELREAANRGANADHANLSRAVTAAARQVAAITALVGGPDWRDLPAELQEVGLARLANPDASLVELGGLLGIGKATAHRRLARLTALAEGEEANHPPAG